MEKRVLQEFGISGWLSIRLLGLSVGIPRGAIKSEGWIMGREAERKVRKECKSNERLVQLAL